MMDIQSFPIWLHGLIIPATIILIGTGAHWLVESAGRLASRLGVSELIIGLTVVAFGTSAPEFAVTLLAAFKGQGDISVGNIVGSNIFNLGFILGGCALVRAIPTTPTLLWRDGSVLGCTTLLLLVLIGWDLQLGRIDGAVLFVLLGVYLGYLYKAPRELPEREELPHDLAKTATVVSWRWDIGCLLLGLLCVVGGSHLMVESATAVARAVGVSEWVIGVTIVAAGTSAPEFATSVVGVIKGRYGISMGNVIGSDIFNLLGVLGVAGLLRPVMIDPVARISLAALCAMVFVVLIFVRSGWRVSRLEGLALVVIAAARWWFDLSAHGP